MVGISTICWTVELIGTTFSLIISTSTIFSLMYGTIFSTYLMACLMIGFSTYWMTSWIFTSSILTWMTFSIYWVTWTIFSTYLSTGTNFSMILSTGTGTSIGTANGLSIWTIFSTSMILGNILSTWISLGTSTLISTIFSLSSLMTWTLYITL